MSAYKSAFSRFGILAVLVAGMLVIAEKPATAFSCSSACMASLQACNQRCQTSNPTFTCVQACESQFLACESKC
jgi:hypothetical protein